MEILIWIIFIGLSVLLGYLFVVYLTCYPQRQRAFLLATLATALALILLAALGLSGWQRWLALPVALGVALPGYLWGAKRVLSRQDERPLPDIRRVPSDPGLGHIAVVYFTHGEPETYDPIGWINQFREFDEQGILFVPLIARPFFLYRLRRAYWQVGRSEHRGMHQRMLRSLEAACRAEGDTSTRFYLCFLDDQPRPDAAVIQALNDGASAIIVSEVFLTISNHTAEGKELIEALEIEKRFGVPVVFSGPLYDSATLKRMFVERANANKGATDKTKVGVLLVGHGQPDEWDREWPTETEQEIGFRQAVLQGLEQEGYASQNLALAWMEFKEPQPAPITEQMVRQGAQEILYFSAAISADSLHSQYDVPRLVAQARVPPSVRLVNLGAWNDDPLVVRAIKEKVDAQKKRLSVNAGGENQSKGHY